VSVTKGENTVSGRSIMGLMMLGAYMGSSIELALKVLRRQQRWRALLALIADRFSRGYVKR